MAKMKAKKIPKKHFLVKALSNCYNFAYLQHDFLLLIVPGIYPQILS